MKWLYKTSFAGAEIVGFLGAMWPGVSMCMAFCFLRWTWASSLRCFMMAGVFIIHMSLEIPVFELEPKVNEESLGLRFRHKFGFDQDRIYIEPFRLRANSPIRDTPNGW